LVKPHCAGVLRSSCARRASVGRLRAGVTCVPRGQAKVHAEQPHGLTGREAQVFVLLSAGLRIRSSKRCLFSPKTVEPMCRNSRESGWHHGRRRSRWRGEAVAGVERDSHSFTPIAKPLRNVVSKLKSERWLGFRSPAGTSRSVSRSNRP